MNSSDFQLLEHAYERAANAAASDRAAIIAELRSRSPDAASKLSEMLEASSIDEHTASELLLELGIGESGSVREGNDHHPPQIDKYRILSTLGEGGWGIVYLAEQPAPAHRLVAIKVIKPGMDSRQVLARFNDERQALAMMDHPCIVSSLDAGMTAQGRPYVVMPLVAGLPINRFCTEEKLSITDRLILMAQVCRGIEYAHAKGVIHRDIKPGNILVVRTESGPIPRIIDFGLAKAMHQPITPHATVTLSGQIIGTPDYMSPEQSRGDGPDVRSDVYSLGAVLYELLAGRTPFDATKLRESGPDGLRAILQNTVPAAPSSVATVPLARELDWIVLRCLEKDANRRYPTAAALADDLDRFLRGDQVNAGPPAKAYRAWQWVVRNRVGVAAATIVLITIFTATALVIKSEAELRVQRQRSELAEEDNRSIFKSIDPEVAQGRDRSLMKVVLDSTCTRFEDPSVDPLVQIENLPTMARAYLALGEAPKAANLAERAKLLSFKHLPTNDPRAFRARVADLLARQLLGRSGPNDAAGNATLPPEAKQLRFELQKYYQNGQRIREWLTIEADLIEIGTTEPEEFNERALLAAKTLGHDDRVTIKFKYAWGRWLVDGNHPTALKYMTDARNLAIARYGEADPISQSAVSVISMAIGNKQGPAAAAEFLTQSLPKVSNAFGENSQKVAYCRLNLGIALTQIGRGDDGVACIKQVIESRRRMLGEHSGLGRWAETALLEAYIRLNRWPEFEAANDALWADGPDGPATEGAAEIMYALHKRGDLKRYERWRTFYMAKTDQYPIKKLDKMLQDNP